MGGQTTKDSAAKTTGKEAFRINWDGTYIDYDFATKKSVAGIILLEVQGAKELPKIKNRELLIMIEALFRAQYVSHPLNSNPHWF